jgi:hypothetical protein
MARHCRTCGETVDDCICGNDDDAAQESASDYGWAGRGFSA